MPIGQHLSGSSKAHTGAVIWLADRMTAVSCVVRELSETGCRLATESAARTPDRFELTLGQSAIIEQCEVTWRRTNELAVRFVRPEPSGEA